MSEPFLGEVRIFSFNFAPTGWAMCSGQLLPISQNAALFAILGTTYGGNGTTNFALPNLQGRTAIGWGTSQGWGPVVLGQVGGEETVTLTKNEMPKHTHLFFRDKTPGDLANRSSAPEANESYLSSYYDVSNGGDVSLSDATPVSTTPPTTPLNFASCGYTGNGIAHENRQPYLVLNPCIALIGIFPSRN